jgi:hypothetical protein
VPSSFLRSVSRAAVLESDQTPRGRRRPSRVTVSSPRTPFRPSRIAARLNRTPSDQTSERSSPSRSELGLGRRILGRVHVGAGRRGHQGAELVAGVPGVEPVADVAFRRNVECQPPDAEPGRPRRTRDGAHEGASGVVVVWAAYQRLDTGRPELPDVVSRAPLEALGPPACVVAGMPRPRLGLGRYREPIRLPWHIPSCSRPEMLGKLVEVSGRVGHCPEKRQ